MPEARLATSHRIVKLLAIASAVLMTAGVATAVAEQGDHEEITVASAASDDHIDAEDTVAEPDDASVEPGAADDEDDTASDAGVDTPRTTARTSGTTGANDPAELAPSTTSTRTNSPNRSTSGATAPSTTAPASNRPQAPAAQDEDEDAEDDYDEDDFEDDSPAPTQPSPQPQPAPQPAPQPQPQPTPQPQPQPTPTPPSTGKSVHLPAPNGTVLARTVDASRAPSGPATDQSLSDYWGNNKASSVRHRETPQFVVRTQADGSRLVGTRQQHDQGRNGGGLNYNVPLSGDANHVTANWIVRLDGDFSFGSSLKGGKLGGLGIGVPVMGGNGTPDKLAEGGSVRVTWHLNEDTGVVSFRPYVYHQNQPTKYGHGTTTNTPVPLGRPFLLTVEVDVDAGSVKMSVDGKVFFQSSDYVWPDDVGVTRFMHHMYHGGGNNNWGPTHNTFSEFLGGQIVAN